MTETTKHASPEHDKRGDFSGGIDVVLAGADVAGDDQRYRSNDQERCGQGVALARQPAGDAGQRPEKGECADSTEPRFGSARMPRSLAFDADRRPSQDGDGDSSE